MSVGKCDPGMIQRQESQVTNLTIRVSIFQLFGRPRRQWNLTASLRRIKRTYVEFRFTFVLIESSDQPIFFLLSFNKRKHCFPTNHSRFVTARAAEKVIALLAQVPSAS